MWLIKSVYLAIRKGRTVLYEIRSQPLKTAWWQRDTKIFACLSFQRDTHDLMPNAIPFWVRVNCDNTISQLEFKYSENELEMPYIMEKLPSHHYIKPSN